MGPSRTLLLATADSLALGVLATAPIGAGMGGEADVTPYLLSRYFGLRAFSALYGLTWTAYAIAGAIGPVLMGRAFDVAGSYATLLRVLAGVMMAVAALMLFLPPGRKINAWPRCRGRSYFTLAYGDSGCIPGWSN